MQREITVRGIAEERVFRNVAVDPELIRYAADPVATLIAEDIAASQLDLVPCLDCLAAEVEGDDRVLDRCRWTAHAAEGNRAAIGTAISVEGALDQCQVTRSGADRTTGATDVTHETALAEGDS